MLYPFPRQNKQTHVYARSHAPKLERNSTKHRLTIAENYHQTSGVAMLQRFLLRAPRMTKSTHLEWIAIPEEFAENVERRAEIVAHPTATRAECRQVFGAVEFLTLLR